MRRFDERGRAVDSAAFAQFIADERDNGRKALWFAIGGAEGLDESVRARATAVFSFGAMTLPHQLGAHSGGRTDLSGDDDIVGSSLPQGVTAIEGLSALTYRLVGIGATRESACPTSPGAGAVASILCGRKVFVARALLIS